MAQHPRHRPRLDDNPAGPPSRTRDVDSRVLSTLVCSGQGQEGGLVTCLRKLLTSSMLCSNIGLLGTLRWFTMLDLQDSCFHLDECGFAPATVRRYGYAPKDQRIDGLGSGHRRTRTSSMAARREGRLEEPFLFEGTCETVVCNSWLKRRLCPRLNDHHLSSSCTMQPFINRLKLRLIEGSTRRLCCP